MPDFQKSKLFPLVSVIVPVYNDLESLKKCIQALEYQTYCKDYYEIIIVDNNSEENLEPIVSQFPNIRYIKELQRGSYAARNTGISIAKGEILGFTDADCIPAYNWIEQGILSLKNSEFDIIAGYIDIFYRQPNTPTAVEFYEKITAFQQDKNVKYNRYGATANLFTKKAVFDRIGYFNPTLISGGDKEWGQRAYASGYSIGYCPNTIVRHPARFSLNQLSSKIQRVTTGQHYLNQLNRTKIAKNQNIEIKNFFRYLLPSPRVIAITIKSRDIKILKKIKVIGIMLYIKYFWLYNVIKHIWIDKKKC